MRRNLLFAPFAACTAAHFIDGTGSPFDGIDVGGRWGTSAPALADLDDDGDLDLVVGAYDGILYYYENVGSATSPSYEAVTGSANPFDGIDLRERRARGVADLRGRHRRREPLRRHRRR